MSSNLSWLTNKVDLMYLYKTVRRFWEYVDIRSSLECWEWTGTLTEKGYGRFHITEPEFNKWVRAHVMSFNLFNERFVEPGLFVCHSCDNPPCCNPRHLWEGDQTSNMIDMVLKGRARNPGYEAGVVTMASFRSNAKRIETMKTIAHQQGAKNSHFGKIWVYNIDLRQSMRIYPKELDMFTSNGWQQGRKIKWPS